VRINAAFGGLVLSATSVVLSAAAPAHAQSFLATASGGVAVVKTLSNRDSARLIGGGAETLSGRLGLGAEVDYVYFPRTTRALDSERGTTSSPAVKMAAVTLKGSHYFGEYPAGRTRPFVSGGFSFLGGGAFGMLLAAGGVDVWTSRRSGIRLEARGQFPIMLAFRCGLVFR